MYRDERNWLYHHIFPRGSRHVVRMPISSPEAVPSEEQIEQFREDGFLFLPKVFEDNTMDQLRREANRILELTVNSSIANGRRNRRLVLNSEGENQSVRTVKPINDLSMVFRRIAVQELPNLLDTLTDDKLVSIDPFSQINYKQSLPEPIEEIDCSDASPGYDAHSDWPYLKDKVPLEEDFLVASIVFIDACTDENGPLQLWPGTHEQEFEHVRKSHGGISIPPDRLSQHDKRKILGPSGSVLFFDSRIVHCSEPNVTDGPRRLTIYRHTSANNITAEVKNGSARVASESEYPIESIESAYENEYRRLKQQDEYHDRFQTPDIRK